MATASKGGGVGKYLKSRNISKAAATAGDDVSAVVDNSRKKRKAGEFNNFSGW